MRLSHCTALYRGTRNATRTPCMHRQCVVPGVLTKQVLVYESYDTIPRSSIEHGAV